jgi:Response regulator of the LytR/AlgR family
MKAIIIEDEEPAAQALEMLIRRLYPEIEIEGVMQSVEESVEWLSLNQMPDLMFMDIRLSDDLSFHIFERVKITCPVIFITAYNEYALKAFETNGLDYLLKPIDEKNLTRSIEKYKNFTGATSGNEKVIRDLIASLKQTAVRYKSYLLVSEKDQLIPLAVRDIAYIYIDTKIVRIVTFDGRKQRIEHTMDEIKERLDPHEFYRANRQYIVARAAIKNASIWFGSKLSVNLITPPPERIYISKARVSDFKNWITD